MCSTRPQLGVNFFDTADMYSNGHNETLIGRAFSTPEMRKKVIIATKGAESGDARHPETLKISNEPVYTKQACEASLKCLKTDYIDLYYLHRVDPKTPFEDSIDALADLVTAGKVRYIGFLEVNAATLRQAHAIHPITALESEYSLWIREVEENEVLTTCQQLNIGFVPFSPLGRGFLAGDVTKDKTYANEDLRRTLPGYQQGNVEANLLLVEQLQQLAQSKGITTAQLALVWV